MDWQFIIVGAIIGIAVFFVGRRVLNKINATRKNSSCDIDCGCESKSKNVFAKSGRN
jgi:uncharacterized membrane-anchored protein YhcB (DUF1043 family)